MTLNKKSTALILFTIIFLGSFLRFYQLGQKSLWTDELATINNTVNIVDLKTFLAHTPGDDLPKFYSLLLKFWMYWGNSEFFMRSLSVIFGILVIAVTYFLSRLFFDYKVSLSAAFLSAFSPFLLLYDREIRVYSLFALLSLLSTYLFIRSLRENKRMLWVSYVVVNVLNIYSHPYAFLIMGVQWLYLLISIRYYKYLIKQWFCVNFIILLFFMIRILQFIKDVAFFAPWVISREKFPFLFGKEFIDFFYNFFSFSIGQTILPWNFLVVPVSVVIFTCFFLVLKNKSVFFQEKLYLLILMFIPILFGVIFRISLPRYFIFIAPVFFIFIAKGLWLLSRKMMIVGFLVIILGWGQGLVNYYNNKEFHFLGTTDPWREVASFLDKNVHQDEILYCIGIGIVPLRYYSNSEIIGFEEKMLLKSIENDKTARVWLVFTYQEEYENWLNARKLFNKDYEVILEKKWGEDPDFVLKSKFFRKNFLAYRIVAELYQRKVQ